MAETSSRRADIQGMRALAVLIVVAYHAGAGFSGGYVGVDVFFVISGYVITRMLLVELGVSETLSFSTFYARRVRRLLPALAVMLAVVLCAGTLLTAVGAQDSTARTGGAAALLNANHHLALFAPETGYFAVDSRSNPLLHTWSLSVEEQFYLLFPLLVLIAWRLGKRRRGVVSVGVGLVVIGAISFPLSIALRHGIGPGGSAASLAFYAAPARAWEFAVGGVLACLAASARRVPTLGREAAAWLGLALIAVATFGFDDATLFPDFAVLVPVAGTALMIFAGEAKRGTTLSRALSFGPIPRVGDLSYGWYLWHWPLIVFSAALWPESSLVAPLAGLASFGLAVVSYRIVEAPIRHNSSMSNLRTLGLAAGCVLAPLAAALVLHTGHGQLVHSRASQPFALHLDVGSGCDSKVPLGERDSSACRWPGRAAGDVVLIGDSNAGQFTEGLLDGTQGVGMNLEVATYSGCPFVPLTIWQNGGELEDCRRFVDATVQALIERRPDVVYVASSSDSYINDSAFQFASDGSSTRGVVPDVKARMWAAAQGQLIGELTAASIHVIVVHPVPKFPHQWSPTTFAPLRLLWAPDGVSAEMSREDALARRELAVSAEKAAADAGGGSTIDPFDELCPAGPCATRVASTWIYRDDGHISVEASVGLGAWFEASLSRALG